MLRTLQQRLILSHLLPLLIIIPLTGLAFIYVIETRVILPNLSQELVTEGGMIAEFASKNPEMWQDLDQLADFMDQFSGLFSARLMLLDPGGTLLLSNDPADLARLGDVIDDEDLASVQKGAVTEHTEYSSWLKQDVIDVFVPVYGPDQSLVGIIRLSHPYTTIYEELFQMRIVILGILAFALLAGIGLGSLLAVTINNPIKQVTLAIDSVASGSQHEKIEQQGTEEIQSLVNSTNTLYQRLHDLELARKQLLANLVHEIGRPLGALRSALQSLKFGAGKDPELLEELTTGMDEETARLQHLLEELSHMHDQIFGTLEVDRKQIAAKTWLRTMLRPWEEAARTKGLEWKLMIPEDLPDFKADPFRMAQAIENLVSNAIKYTSRGGKVCVAAEADLTGIRFLVSDTGPGITEAEREKIFTPFYRGDQKRKIKQGMGLGLSIAKDVVVAHGGEILLESQPGSGSSFTIFIPKV